MIDDARRRGHSADGSNGSEPIVTLQSTFVPSGEVARREYPVECESIPSGSEPGHWPVLAVRGDGRLLLDTDALRAVWTGPGLSPWVTEGDRQ